MAKKKDSAKKSQKKKPAKKSQKKSASKKSKQSKSSAKKTTKKSSTTKSITKKKEPTYQASQPETNKRSFWLATLAVLALIAIIFVALMLTGKSSVNDDSNEVVLVNGQAIYASEIQQVYSQLPPQAAAQYTPKDITDQLITLELVLQYAESRGISASDEQVESYIDELVAQAGGSRELLDEQLSAANISAQELREEVRQRVIVNNLQDVILEETEVTVQEVQRAYADNLDQYQAGENQVRIRHILVSSESLANQLAQQARSGEDFAALAREFSEGPSSTMGGDLGFVDNTTAFVEPFKTVALSLEPNEISDPVQTDFGWHVIYRGDDLISLDEVREELEIQVKQRKAQANFAQTLEDLRSEAEIIYVQQPEDVI